MKAASSLHKSSQELRLPALSRRTLFSRRNALRAFLALAACSVLIYIIHLRAGSQDGRFVVDMLAFDGSSPPGGPGKDQAWEDRANWRKDADTTIGARHSAFKPEDFTKEAIATNGLIPVSAVILAWKRLDSLKLVVKYLRKYPFIQEILIWNNNDEMQLSAADFGEGEPSMNALVKVFNSNENLHDMAKYMTCSMAEHDHCYFQDDDWLNLHIDSQYSNFLRSPDLIHSTTMPMIHIEHRRWTFTDPTFHLHSGFTWMGCGAFFPREKAQRFLAQLGSSDLPKEKLRLADMYFSIWTNQYPYQISNPLTPLDQRSGWSERPDQWNIVFTNMLDAAKRLGNSLQLQARGEEGDFEVEEALPLIRDRHVRSPCFNDQCLFITSLDAFPDPKAVTFHMNATSIQEHERQFYDHNFPANDFWDKHSYHHAVDGDPSTCWNSHKHPKVGDYFGLQFVKPFLYEKITIFSSKDISNFDASFNIGISVDGMEWKECKRMHQDQRDGQRTEITIDFNCLGLEPVSFIKLEAARNFTEPFEICSLHLNGLEV